MFIFCNRIIFITYQAFKLQNIVLNNSYLNQMIRKLFLANLKYFPAELDRGFYVG